MPPRRTTVPRCGVSRTSATCRRRGWRAVRRLRAFVVCVALLASVTSPASAASAAGRPYTHVWFVQGTVGGDLGGAGGQKVQQDEMTLTLDGRRVLRTARLPGRARDPERRRSRQRAALLDPGDLEGDARAGRRGRVGDLPGQGAAGRPLGAVAGGRRDLCRTWRALRAPRSAMTSRAAGRRPCPGGMATGADVRQRAAHRARLAGAAARRAWFDPYPVPGFPEGQTFRVEVAGLAATPGPGAGTGGRGPAADSPSAGASGVAAADSRGDGRRQLRRPRLLGLREARSDERPAGSGHAGAASGRAGGRGAREREADRRRGRACRRGRDRRRCRRSLPRREEPRGRRLEATATRRAPAAPSRVASASGARLPAAGVQLARAVPRERASDS